MSVDLGKDRYSILDIGEDSSLFWINAIGCRVSVVGLGQEVSKGRQQTRKSVAGV